ncbi:MAG: nitroreductase family protein [Acidimicrobiales bacterium]
MGDVDPTPPPGEPGPDFFDVVLTQRAARSFRPDDVDEALVTRVLTAATHAPSAENSQPFVFVVVRDAALRASIGAITAEAWEAGARDHEVGRLPPGLWRDVDQGARGGVAGAPVLIAVCGDTRLAPATTLGASVYPATQNLLLAAHALGLGSALTTLPVVAGTGLSELLGLPPEVVPLAVVPLGHLAKRLGPPRRLPLAQKAHRERYGTPYP